MRFNIRTSAIVCAATMILASALASAPAIAAAAMVQLTLKADAMVGGARVTLADVATFDDGDQRHHAAGQALAEIDLGAAPRPGYTDRYTRKEIERLVRARSLGGAVIWRGADAVRVERIAQVFDSSKIADRAEAYLRELFSSDGSRLELQLSAPLPDLSLPAGKLELRPRAMQAAQALHSRVAVWIDVVIDGVFVRSVTVPFNVQAYRPMLVAKRDLPKGTEPQCDALQVRDEDVAALDSPPFPADCKLVQGHLKRTLAVGMPLLKSSLQAPVAVAQGDSVSLQLVAGALLLESRAIATADGEVGERIRVKPSASTETVLAEVIAPGVVKVSEK